MSTEEGKEPDGRINLRLVKALVVDSTNLGMEILGQMLMGFGVERILRAQTGEEARKILQRESVDLILSDGTLADETGFDLVRWLRRTTLEPNRFSPVIIVSGHTRLKAVEHARDSGANFVVAKPMSPTALMQRILWVAKGGRTFVEAEKFVGPDRRHKHTGTFEGGEGRRKNDLSAAVGAATDPNMSQQEIDTMIRPQKVSL